jgi:hypothetical protein
MTRPQRNQSSCIPEARCQVTFSLRKIHLAHRLLGHVYPGFALKPVSRLEFTLIRRSLLCIGAFSGCASSPTQVEFRPKWKYH